MWVVSTSVSSPESQEWSHQQWLGFLYSSLSSALLLCWVHPISKCAVGYFNNDTQALRIFTFVTTDAWSDQVVSLHDQARAQYGAGPVTWNSELYSSTLSYAQGCIFVHRCEQLFSCMATELIIYVTSASQGQYGENLAGHLLSWEFAGG